ncbi:subfamily B ATP-binding cassette protein HlyB/CyaB [Sulfuritortus calidifontis]|uniref:Subfamily B ATP-binding cassette protein HlyB/CyaB n=1 Tax=Sulfuritortus calidifontis TaxID=1914471 RepID=A0A4R3JWE8_9PROT|nr:peptidase domain-containing ABC transporter [Sulfuritortus calidifontis]TCS72638.1 subfamily B ATP-binding cassette protein HlyB/CyaB [Sulfuritortus calidifontis]
MAEQSDAQAQPLLHPISHDELLWLLGSLCNRYRIPFDAALIAQEFPPPYTLATFHEAARSLGLKTGNRELPGVDWQGLPLPAIAFIRATPQHAADVVEGGKEGELTLAEPTADLAEIESEPSADHGAPAQPSVPVLILNSEAGQLLYFRPGAQAPESLPAGEAAAWFEPELVLVTKESVGEGKAEEIPGFETEKKEFGFSWFIPELLKHKLIWRDVLLASLAIQLVGLATPVFTQVIIDKVVVHQTQSTLWVIGIALIMFLVFTTVMSWLRQYLVLHTGNRIDAVLGSQVFRHLLRLPMPYFEHRPTGTLVARLQGVETIREFVSGAAITLLLDFPFLLIFLAVMFAYSWQLSLIAVGLLGVICVLSFLVVPIFRERLNKQFMLGARNQAFLTEYLSGMATVKSLQMEPDIDRKYGDLFAQYLAAGFSAKQAGNTYNVVTNGVEQVMTLSILIVGALLVMQNDGFTVGMLVAFQMFASRMSQPMLRLAGLWQEFQQADIAVKRLGDILDMPQEPHTLTPKRENAGQGRIDLAGIGFRYSEHHPWLYRNLNLTLKPGHLTVLMGPSGSGKSTLAKLLLGFYLPQEGNIKLDGKDIRTMAANELRTAFGVVPQETVLFSGTVYDNLVMAHPHAGFEDVIAACKAAEIHDVIEHLPEGYQTELGEHGVGLSGGQRQRIAIARALLKRPKILVFDEAVSNLDQQTAEGFAKTINQLKGKVTMLFITHQIPRGLQVDEVLSFGPRQQATRMEVVEDERRRDGDNKETNETMHN